MCAVLLAHSARLRLLVLKLKGFAVVAVLALPAGSTGLNGRSRARGPSPAAPFAEVRLSAVRNAEAPPRESDFAVAAAAVGSFCFAARKSDWNVKGFTASAFFKACLQSYWISSTPSCVL